jgi:hypothetical protein
MKKYLFTLPLLFLTLQVKTVLAVDQVITDLGKNLQILGSNSGYGISSADGTLESRIQNILTYILGVIGALSVIFILYGGYQWLVSAGNASKAEDGKKTVIRASIGLVVVSFAYTIIRFAIFLISDN